MNTRKETKYIKDILGRFEKALDNIESSEMPSEISKMEMECMRVINELQMAIPRIGNDLSATSRKRRQEIAEGK